MALTIIGSVAYDSISSQYGSVTRVLGGSGTYASVAASLFSSVDLISVVGRDFNDWDVFSARPIDVSGIDIQSDMDTFHWQGSYESDIHHAVTIQTDINCLVAFQPVIPEHSKANPGVLLANCDPDVQWAALQQCVAPHLVVVDSMNYWIASKPDAVKRIMTMAGVAILNDAELLQLTGSATLLDGMHRLQSWGAQRVIVKKGEHGAMMLGPDGLFVLPALPVDRVVDPTGAGDTFAGALAGYLTAHPSPTETTYRQAMLVGTVAASHTIRAFSIQALDQVTPHVIREGEQRLRHMMAID
ncbi:sugar kinase [bacterium]|nr:sugar kinase [bacterium]